MSSRDEGCIRLQLTVGNQGREVVKRTTAKGHEVVEVNGFTFVRKRKAPEPPQQPQQQQHLPYHTPKRVACSQPAAASTPAAAQPLPAAPPDAAAAACAEGSLEVDAPELLPTQILAPPSPPCSQEHAAAAPGCLAEDLGTQLASCLPTHCPTLVKLQFVVARAMEVKAAQMAAQEGEQAGRAATLSRAGRLVGHAFGRLLACEVDGCRQQLVAAATAAGAGSGAAEVAAEAVAGSAADGAAAPLQEQQQGAGAPEAGGPGFGALPPVLRDAVTQGSALAHSLRAQLARLEAEEAAWQGMNATYTRAPGPAAGAACSSEGAAAATAAVEEGAGAGGGAEAGEATTRAAVEAAAALPLPADGAGSPAAQQQQQQQEAGPGAGGSTPAPAAEASGVVAACASELDAARAQAGAQLVAQVEVLAGRLSRVELMVAQAEHVASAMQADYHQDRFRTFPHVNSPAWLIRRITHAPRPELWGGVVGASAEAAV